MLCTYVEMIAQQQQSGKFEAMSVGGYYTMTSSNTLTKADDLAIVSPLRSSGAISDSGSCGSDGMLS
jgi:hypothetical protein